MFKHFKLIRLNSKCSELKEQLRFESDLTKRANILYEIEKIHAKKKYIINKR